MRIPMIPAPRIRMKAAICRSIEMLGMFFESEWPALVGIPGRIPWEYALFIYL